MSKKLKIGTFFIIMYSLFLFTTCNKQLPAEPAYPTPSFVLSWGVSGTGSGQFNHPQGIAIDNTSELDIAVYVTDYNNNRVQKFDSNGNFILQWGVSGSGVGEFIHPSDITIDTKTNTFPVIYVVDTDNDRVQKFNSHGGYISEFGGTGTLPEQFTNPLEIALDVDGNIYVTDQMFYIKKFDPSCTFIKLFNGSADVFVADNITNTYTVFFYSGVSDGTITKVTIDGYLIMYVGKSGTQPGEIYATSGITVDAYGNIYGADGALNRVQKYTPTGLFLVSWGKPGAGSGEFNWPGHLAIDKMGYIYVVDRGNNRIQKFKPTEFQ